MGINYAMVGLTILSTIITMVLIPYLREKRMENAAAVAVGAAEQLYKLYSKAGDEKKIRAMEHLRRKFPHATDAELEDFLEAAVYELNKWKKELEK